MRAEDHEYDFSIFDNLNKGNNTTLLDELDDVSLNKKVKDINLFNDEGFENAIKKIEDFYNQKTEVLEIKPEPLPEVLEIKKEKKPTTFEESFVNCSILGFVTLFMGFSWFFYIMSQV